MLTTSTLRFVDIRICHNRSKPDDPGLHHEADSAEQLEWAFAGTSSSQTVVDQSLGPVRECRWEHWIDSRVVLGAEPQDDSGHMYELENGMTLEKGVMKDTASGQIGPYEELWKDMPIESVSANGSKVSILAKMGGAHDIRGMIARVGRWVQGILSRDGEIRVERWKWREESGRFERVFGIGRPSLPCFIVFDNEGTLEAGKTFEIDMLTWEVLEKYQWD